MIKPVSFVIFCSATLYLILFYFVSAFAAEPVQSGFSGYVLVGGAYSTGKHSLEDASTDKNRRIRSLAESSSTTGEMSLLAAGGLNYTFESTGTVLSLGPGHGKGTLAVTQPFETAGTFSLGISYQRDEIWQDPFVTRTERRETDRETRGGVFSWDHIMNSGFFLSYAFDIIDVDEDVSGARNVDLKREGKRHTLTLGSLLFENDSQELSGHAVYEDSDMDGKSYSSKGYGIGLAHTLKAGRWDLQTGVSLMIKDYDKTHPEFGKARDENIFAVSSAYTFHEPFGFKNYYVTVFGGYERTDANINFYDASVFSVGAGVGYTF